MKNKKLKGHIAQPWVIKKISVLFEHGLYFFKPEPRIEVVLRKIYLLRVNGQYLNTTMKSAKIVLRKGRRSWQRKNNGGVNLIRYTVRTYTNIKMNPPTQLICANKMFLKKEIEVE
jgi:hypothetical protein